MVNQPFASPLLFEPSLVWFLPRPRCGNGKITIPFGSAARFCRESQGNATFRRFLSRRIVKAGAGGGRTDAEAAPSHTALTNPSSTFFWPARSKSMVSLLPSMAAMLPLPNFWWKTRSPTAKGEGVSAPGFACPHLASSVQLLTVFCGGSAQELAFA